MNFSNRNKKTKIYTKDSVVVIVQQKAKTKTLSLQGIIDYKNLFLLRKFITAEGKILPRRISGLNAKQQRYIAKAIKNARMVGLLPFINHSKHPRI